MISILICSIWKHVEESLYFFKISCDNSCWARRQSCDGAWSPPFARRRQGLAAGKCCPIAHPRQRDFPNPISLLCFFLCLAFSLIPILLFYPSFSLFSSIVNFVSWLSGVVAMATTAPAILHHGETSFVGAISRPPERPPSSLSICYFSKKEIKQTPHLASLGIVGCAHIHLQKSVWQKNNSPGKSPST